MTTGTRGIGSAVDQADDGSAGARPVDLATALPADLRRRTERPTAWEDGPCWMIRVAGWIVPVEVVRFARISVAQPELARAA